MNTTITITSDADGLHFVTDAGVGYHFEDMVELAEQATQDELAEGALRLALAHILTIGGDPTQYSGKTIQVTPGAADGVIVRLV